MIFKNKEEKFKQDKVLYESAITEAKKVEPLKSGERVMHTMWILLRILKEQNINGDVLEIGTKKGKTTVFLANILSHMYNEIPHLYSIDPFSIDGAKKSLKSEANQIDSIYKTFLHHTKNLKNHTHFRCSSENLVTLLPPNCNLMLTFIDGEHTFEAVIRDFTNVFDMTVDNGIIAVDDFQSGTWLGVPKAFAEILKIYDDAIKIQKKTAKTVFVRKIKHVSRPSII